MNTYIIYNQQKNTYIYKHLALRRIAWKVVNTCVYYICDEEIFVTFLL